MAPTCDADILFSTYRQVRDVAAIPERKNCVMTRTHLHIYTLDFSTPSHRAYCVKPHFAFVYPSLPGSPECRPDW